MAKKITYAEIGQIIGKNEQTIKGYKQSNPELLKVLKLGARAHLNNIDDKKLELFAELLEKLGEKKES